MCSCGDDHEYVPSGRHIYAGGSEELTVTRRDVLKGGVGAAVATGAAALFGQPIALRLLLAQVLGRQAQEPVRVADPSSGATTMPAISIRRRSWRSVRARQKPPG